MSALRERLVAGGPPLLLAGAPNALTARLVEEAGFEAVYLSGAGIANAYLGAPDIGLVGLAEVRDHVAAVRDAVALPLVVDIDTGFGNAVGVRRTVRELERAGADAVQLEDQVEPKRCGHFTGKSVVPAAEMVGKISAALDARDDLLVIARTDARAVEGLDGALERAERYRDAGADLIFVEAPVSRAELAEIPRRVPGLHVANMVEGGVTPVLPLGELAGLGFAVVLYANTALRAAISGMRPVLEHLCRHGDTLAVADRIAGWSERQQLVRKPFYDALDAKYAAEDTDE